MTAGLVAQVANTVQSESALFGIVLSIAGVLALYIGRVGNRAIEQLESVVRKVDRVEVAIYGDERDPEPNGLKRETKAIRSEMTAGFERQGDFNAGIVKAIAEHHRLLDERTERRTEPR